MHSLKALLAAIGLMVVGLQAMAQELSLAANTWPPYVDKRAQGGGLAVELVTRAFQRAGYGIDLTIESWSRTLEGAEIGVYDVIVAAWFTEERDKKYAYSQPYLVNEVRFMKRKSSNIEYNELRDLKGHTVGYIRNYAYGTEFARADYLVKIPENHVIQALTRLTAGQLDLVVGDERVLRHELKKYLSNNIDKVEFLEKPLSRRNLHIAVSRQRKDYPKIIEDFDREIKAMKGDGEYKKIVAKHAAVH